MITELDAIDGAEQILAQHWTYIVLPTERRAIRATQRLEVQPVGHPDQVTFKDLAILLLACILLLAIGWNLS